jgi:hypothetical protein
MELKRNTRLIGARSTETNFPLAVYDDGDGPLWLFGHEYGASLLIRARSYETAWEIAVDEAKPIDEAEVPEAYGFDGPNAALELRHAVERADAGAGEYPELVEGYEHQANATGTGIVNLGHYTWLREFGPDDRADYRLVIRSDDCPLVDVVFEAESYGFAYTVEHETHRARSFSVLRDIGAVLRGLEQQYHGVNATVRWRSGT